jgi:hypothetical protein
MQGVPQLVGLLEGSLAGVGRVVRRHRDDHGASLLAVEERCQERPQAAVARGVRLVGPAPRRGCVPEAERLDAGYRRGPLDDHGHLVRLLVAVEFGA